MVHACNMHGIYMVSMVYAYTLNILAVLAWPVLSNVMQAAAQTSLPTLTTVIIYLITIILSLIFYENVT